jgi:hypothetical protein
MAARVTAAVEERLVVVLATAETALDQQPWWPVEPITAWPDRPPAGPKGRAGSQKSRRGYWHGGRETWASFFGCTPAPSWVDHVLVRSARTDRSPGQPLRTAAIGGLAFTILYLVHRLLQGTGPDGSSAGAVAAYQVAHGGALLASEVAVGLALLAFIGFLAGLVPVIWRAGQETLAVAVAISGGVFVAMGFASNAAETALIGVADANQPAAVLVLDELQGRIPIVWTITALVAALSVAIWRTGLVGRWLGPAGLAAAAVFLVGSVFSVLGPTPEGSSSLVGVGLFIVWMLAVSVGLWRTAALGGV